MSAIRLARAATGREQVLKFAGAYHGHVDGLLAEAGSGLATQGIPASPGVPASAAARRRSSCRGTTATRSSRRPSAHELAAILAEPLPANMGLVPPQPGFLELLRERADATGALLVFDEVISGFRVARGGAQERCGVHARPDDHGQGDRRRAAGRRATAGARELMERLAPAGDVYQAGTLSGNPLAVAAGLATLELLDETAYARLGEHDRARSPTGLRDAAARRLVGRCRSSSVPGPADRLLPREPRARLRRRARACDRDAYAAWCRELLARGVYPPPSQFEAWFPSLAHDEAADRAHARGGRGGVRGARAERRA